MSSKVNGLKARLELLVTAQRAQVNPSELLKERAPEPAQVVRHPVSATDPMPLATMLIAPAVTATPEIESQPQPRVASPSFSAKSQAVPPFKRKALDVQAVGDKLKQWAAAAKPTPRPKYTHAPLPETNVDKLVRYLEDNNKATPPAGSTARRLMATPGARPVKHRLGGLVVAAVLVGGGYTLYAWTKAETPIGGRAPADMMAQPREQVRAITPATAEARLAVSPASLVKLASTALGLEPAVAQPAPPVDVMPTVTVEAPSKKDKAAKDGKPGKKDAPREGKDHVDLPLVSLPVIQVQPPVSVKDAAEEKRKAAQAEQKRVEQEAKRKAAEAEKAAAEQRKARELEERRAAEAAEKKAKAAQEAADKKARRAAAEAERAAKREAESADRKARQDAADAERAAQKEAAAAKKAAERQALKERKLPQDLPQPATPAQVNPVATASVATLALKEPQETRPREAAPAAKSGAESLKAELLAKAEQQRAALQATQAAAQAPKEDSAQKPVRRIKADQLMAELGKLIVYPAVSVEENQQGTVTLLLSLTKEGRVLSVRIQDSSGYKALDAAAVRAARQLPLLPAYAGQELSLPVVFRLN